MRTSTLLAAASLSTLMACGPGLGRDGDTDGPALGDRALVTAFADGVVVPTYTLLAARVTALETAVDALASNPSSVTLAAAQTAWLAARSPWEQGEGFLFGPVDAFGYDPALDSWPVNNTDLDAVLQAGEAFTPTYVANLQETQKGFHTLEYLLFGLERSKTVDRLTARELQYLRAIASELAEVANALLTSWTEPVDGRPPFREVFVSAGGPGNTAYPSLSAAVQEILQGMVGICDEVANGKIADPYDAHDAMLVESQFALNSLTDFQNNLRSVENAYTGAVPDAATHGRGLSDLIAAIDAPLDARVRRELQLAIDAIGAIPPPFRSAIVTRSSYDDIEAAQAAIRVVQDTLERDVQPLVLR